MVTVSQKLKFIKQAFGSFYLDRGGHNVAVKCPACGENDKKKFSINLETWQSHCWVCGIKSTNLLSILRKHVSSNDCRIF